MRQTLFFNNKRGISPLIATVLLIAFAVALGAVVMNWGKNYVMTTAKDAQENGQAKQRCANTVMEFVQTSGVPMMCVDHLTNASEIRFTIKNKASHSIVDMGVTVLGSTDIYEKLLTNDSVLKLKFSGAGLAQSRMIQGVLNVSGVGSFQKIIFTPYIKIDGRVAPEPCSDNTLFVDSNEAYECE
jgi:flagellin-like protein